MSGSPDGSGATANGELVGKIYTGTGELTALQDRWFKIIERLAAVTLDDTDEGA